MKHDYITMTIAVIAIIIAIVALVYEPKALAQDKQSKEGDTLQKMRTTGKLDVCYAEYPPAVIKNPKTGKLSGHAIDAIGYIAKQVGADIMYHETTWGNGAADVATGRCDVMLMYFNKISRAFSIAFTQPMVYIGDSALVRVDDHRFDTVKDITEFDKPEYTVVVANGESGHVFVKENFKHAKIEVIDVEAGDLLKFLALVSTGRADVGITDSVSTSLYQREHPETRDVFANNPFNLNPTAFGVRQDDITFLNFLNDALLTMDVQGKLAEFEKKYDAHWLHLQREYVVN